MNNEWARQKLEDYLNYINAYLNHPREGGHRPDNPTRGKLRAKEPTVKEILRHLGPELADFNFEGLGGEEEARNSVMRGLGILNDRDEWAANLAPEGPSLSADKLHAWVWDAALTLWDSKHYREAVHAAATAINAHTQNKLGRRDVADDRLMQEAFTPNAPEPSKPRLRCPGDQTDQTTQSRQRGALQFAVGCFQAIRNPAAHEPGEWEQQIALEYLATLSTLARWIDSWALQTVK